MIELLILLQLIDTSFDTRFEFNQIYEDQKEVDCARLFHINKVWFVIFS